MNLLDSVKKCVDSARRYGRHDFTIAGELGSSDIRCQAFFAAGEKKEFVLTLLWIDEGDPGEAAAVSLAVLFAIAAHSESTPPAPRLVGTDRSRTLPSGKEMRRYVYVVSYNERGAA